MNTIIYDPSDVGKTVINSRGKNVKIRKYHLTNEEKDVIRARWLEEIEHVDKRTKEKAHPNFFNPYRKGIYHHQIQALYLLGCNEWHSLSDVLNKLESHTALLPLKITDVYRHTYGSVWDKFRGKSRRENAQRCKDHIGRVQENFILFQRLSKLHPYGYKLHQACGAIDIRRINKEGFTSGAYFYRLSTYGTQEEALPIRDFSRFTFPSHEKKHISYKFVGTTITKDKVIKEGIII